MIVVDSSALIAILEKEGDALRYAVEIEKADRLLISAVNVASGEVPGPWRSYGVFFARTMILRLSPLMKRKPVTRSRPSTGLVRDFMQRRGSIYPTAPLTRWREA